MFTFINIGVFKAQNPEIEIGFEWKFGIQPNIQLKYKILFRFKRI